jgi:hypothetical protein
VIVPAWRGPLPIPACAICRQPIDEDGPRPESIQVATFQPFAMDFSEASAPGVAHWLVWARHADCSGPVDLRDGKILR